MGLKKKIKKFWNSNPCGQAFTAKEVWSKDFFEDLRKHRYLDADYLLNLLRSVDFKGKSVLENGCGLGTDLRQIKNMGGNVTGLDLSIESLKLAKRGFEICGLDGNFINADVENLPFQDRIFDITYSFGSLHHTPNTKNAIRENHRVLKPKGTAIVMLYNRNSFYYYIDYRFGIARMKRAYSKTHVLLAEIIKGIVLRSDDVKFADGKDNPLGKCYSKKECKELFEHSSQVKILIRYFPSWMIPSKYLRLPTTFLYPLSKLIGWHTIIIAKKER